MHLEKIITLANRNVLYPFLAMERSLRATGCDLPLWVIPYNDDRFELPPKAFWWEPKDFFAFLEDHQTKPTMRRYACLTQSNFQYIDSDCIFLKNPYDALLPHSGWVTCCCHWHNPEHTFTQQSLLFLKKQSTTWQKTVFNSGQFACEENLYNFKTLEATVSHPAYKKTILLDPFHEQPGLNWLVAMKTEARYTNLTLPPHNIESSWAGDYEIDPTPYWKDLTRKPYLIHWAGQKPNGSRKIDELFFQYLEADEKKSYLLSLKNSSTNPIKYFKNKLRRAF
jgi:hypothetical protein